MSAGFYQRELDAETWRRFERMIGREIAEADRALSRWSLSERVDGASILTCTLHVPIREITMTVSLGSTAAPSDVERVSTWEKDRGEA